jgi:hypothetical protein
MNDPDEVLDVVDEHDQVIGQIRREDELKIEAVPRQP